MIFSKLASFIFLLEYKNNLIYLQFHLLYNLLVYAMYELPSYVRCCAYFCLVLQYNIICVI